MPTAAPTSSQYVVPLSRVDLNTYNLCHHNEIQVSNIRHSARLDMPSTHCAYRNLCYPHMSDHADSTQRIQLLGYCSHLYMYFLSHSRRPGRQLKSNCLFLSDRQTASSIMQPVFAIERRSLRLRVGVEGIGLRKCRSYSCRGLIFVPGLMQISSCPT